MKVPHSTCNRSDSSSFKSITIFDLHHSPNGFLSWLLRGHLAHSFAPIGVYIQPQASNEMNVAANSFDYLTELQRHGQDLAAISTRCGLWGFTNPMRN
jgi:hypothetical protein